jgi:hypothetical protein
MMAVPAVMMMAMPAMVVAITPDVQVDARPIVAAVVAAAMTIAVPVMTVTAAATAMITMHRFDCALCARLRRQRCCIAGCRCCECERCAHGCNGQKLDHEVSFDAA